MIRAITLLLCIGMIFADAVPFVNSFGVSYDTYNVGGPTSNFFIDDRDRVAGVDHYFYFNLNSPVALTGDITGASDNCQGQGVCSTDGNGQFWGCGSDPVLSDHPAGPNAGFTATYTGGLNPPSKATRNTIIYYTCPD
ncbi:hypothetical protein KIPB_016419, partial [Kipferlia bialata]|eukprot:g16419.t1